MNDEILVVGCGSIGERHLRCLQRTGRAKLTACTAPVRPSSGALTKR